MREKILFGAVPRQLRKVLDWRSLLVFLVMAPLGVTLVILTGGELLRLSMKNDLYIFTVNILSWIPPLIAIQITYLIRKYQVSKHEDRLLDEISDRDVFGLLNSPIVVVLVGAITTGLLEAYLFQFIGIVFDFNSVSAFWAWPGMTWARWTPLLFITAGTFWLLRESEKDRAQFMELESTKYPALGRYQSRLQLAVHTIFRAVSSLWASSPLPKKVGPRPSPDTASTSIGNSFVIAVDAERATYPRMEEVQEYSDSIEVLRAAIADTCTNLIEEITSRLEGYQGCLVGLRDASKTDEAEVLRPYEEAILDGTLDSSLGDGIILYLRFEDRHDSDVINEEFLSMNSWGFGAHWVDENEQVRSQSYDFGEFDTGYYAAIEWGNDETDYLDAAFQPQIGLQKAAKLSSLEMPQIEKSPDTLDLDTDSEAQSDANSFVVAVYTGASVYSRLEEAQEASESVEDWRDAVVTACADLVEEIASRLDGYNGCLVGSLEGGSSDESEVLGQYPTPILDGTLDDNLDGFILYMRFDERHDSDVINAEFLSMDEWGFGAHWVDENEQVRSQSYDFGEFDTGYYAAIEWGNDQTDYLDAAFQPQIGLRKAARYA